MMSNGREKSSGKKQKSKGGGRGRSDDVDDVASVDEIQAGYSEAASAQRSNKNEDGEEKTVEDLQDEMVEQLAEKRASTRMAALTRLIDQLQTTVDYEFVSSRFDTLEMYLLLSIKKGDAAEVALACRALSLVAVTLGAEADKLVADATPALNEYLKNTSKSPSGRAAVAEAMGFINFIGSINDHETLAAMGLLWEQLRMVNLPEAIATSAWEAWGLLASTLPTSKLAGDILNQHLPHLIKYLDHESIDVKTAAGECIALLWEAKQQREAELADEGEEESEDTTAAAEAEAQRMEDEELTPLGEAAIPTPATSEESKMSDAPSSAPLDFVLSASTRSPALLARKRPMPKQHPQMVKSDSTSSNKSGAGNSGGPGGVIDEADLIARFTALARDSGRYQSKKDRATQKKNFREFLRTVEDGDVPDESLKIEKSRHEFSGWSHIVQLDAIRDVIGKGLNTHFVHNETIMEIFDLYSQDKGTVGG